MNYKYKMTDTHFIINFSESCPFWPVDIVSSQGFKSIVEAYLNKLKKDKGSLYNFLYECSNGNYDQVLEDLPNIFRYLMVMSKEELSYGNEDYVPYLSRPHLLLKVVEGLYLFWRRFQRYGIVFSEHDADNLEDKGFMSAQNNFQNIILCAYRAIYYSLGFSISVFRQTLAGLNVALSLSLHDVCLPHDYQQLKGVPFIDKATIYPPFITYSKSYIRSGLFSEVFDNPLDNTVFNQEEWMCYPAKVGNLIIFVYFHISFLCQGVSLMNLFEMASYEEFECKKPDLIYVCGYDDGKKNQIFYHDKKNDIVVGYLSQHDDFDYFGYMKKMILTLHNIRQIDNGCLPIHGAMIEIMFKDGTNKNVIIVGDSGAGKSETIEQIKAHNSNKIDQIKVVYDDMGLLSEHDDGQIVSSGTEIGAFIRLNDLESGTEYNDLDRAVIMNPDKPNARIVVPNAMWNDVVWKYNIDYLFYANNYESADNVIEYFDDEDTAIEVFEKGRRMSKGTTSENGITQSFFANPFGPTQRKDECKKLLKKYFSKLIEQGVKIGQIYTCLGVDGMSQKGPKKAAEEFLKQF